MCQSAGRNCSTIDSPPTTTLVSASHRLAGHYDILWRIFNGQRGRGTPHPHLLSRADLARCTRVSRAFHEPVVRVLWSSLDGFIPLWQLLAPADLPYRAQYTQEYFRKVDTWQCPKATRQLIANPCRRLSMLSCGKTLSAGIDSPSTLDAS